MARLYLQDILLPDERILHHAKVHYILYAPGILTVLGGYAVLYLLPELLLASGVASDTRATAETFGTFIGATALMAGVAMLLRAWLRIYSTELLITDMRVLVKVGISAATTAEIDRNRISSVIITKPLLGRLLNYGWVSILGFSGDITGLPVVEKPHEIQKHIYARR